MIKTVWYEFFEALKIPWYLFCLGCYLLKNKLTPEVEIIDSDIFEEILPVLKANGTLTVVQEKRIEKEIKRKMKEQ